MVPVVLKLGDWSGPRTEKKQRGGHVGALRDHVVAITEEQSRADGRCFLFFSFYLRLSLSLSLPVLSF